jgi:hypothetical protein
LRCHEPCLAMRGGAIQPATVQIPDHTMRNCGCGCGCRLILGSTERDSTDPHPLHAPLLAAAAQDHK